MSLNRFRTAILEEKVRERMVNVCIISEANEGVPRNKKRVDEGWVTVTGDTSDASGTFRA